MKLYRYSQRHWLEKSLELGEFLLRPASYYDQLENDAARQDNELVRTRSVDGKKLTMTVLSTGQPIIPIGEVRFEKRVNTDYYMICFSTTWALDLFDTFANSDACLIIHNLEAFRNRLHGAVEATLPNFAGIDDVVTYGRPHSLGAVFEKSEQFGAHAEWKFAWRPHPAIDRLSPITVSIGSISDIAQLLPRPQNVS